jgi:hypothetical protein
MKEDEKQFLIDLYKSSLKLMCKILSPRDIINSDNFKMNHKRAWYLLEKWSDKDWYEYGVCLDLGWLTDKGKEKAIELLREGE